MIELRPMTREDLTAVMRLEEELFAPDTWTRAMYLEELGMTDTRSYTVAVDGDEVVGYAGLIAYPDEAHVATIGVTGSGRARASARAARRAAGRGRPAQPRGAARGAAGDEATQGLYARRGFVPIGVRPNYYPNSGEDAVVMKRG